MMGNKEREVFVFAKVFDHPGCVDDVATIERKLYMGPLSVTKKLRFYDPDDVGGKGGREDMHSHFVRQFWKDLVQVTV